MRRTFASERKTIGYCVLQGAATGDPFGAEANERCGAETAEGVAERSERSGKNMGPGKFEGRASLKISSLTTYSGRA